MFLAQVIAKVEDFLHQIAESMDPSEHKSRLLEVAVIVNGIAASLGPAVHNAIEKAINARMSARKEAAKHLTAEVKMDVLLSDPFHPDLCSATAVKKAFESMPSMPMLFCILMLLLPDHLPRLCAGGHIRRLMFYCRKGLLVPDPAARGLIGVLLLVSVHISISLSLVTRALVGPFGVMANLVTEDGGGASPPADFTVLKAGQND